MAEHISAEALHKAHLASEEVRRANKELVDALNELAQLAGHRVVNDMTAEAPPASVGSWRDDCQGG